MIEDQILIHERSFGIFTIEELRALYHILEHEYIAYDNSEAREVVNKIYRILTEIDKNDMDKRVSKPT
jgi:hypothetical protein